MELKIVPFFLAIILGAESAGAQQCGGSCKQDSLAFAYQYGYPIYPYGEFALGLPEVKSNFLYRASGLATAANRSVVRPNVDTLYTVLLYDLSAANLEFTVPEFDDRFWVFPFYDFYGDNFANVASVLGNQPGKYLLRLTNNNFGVQTENITGNYKAYVNSPTPYGAALIRIVLKNNTTDLQLVLEYETKITVSPVNATRPTKIPPLDFSVFEDVKNSTPSSPEVVLRLTAELAPYNLPEVLSDRAWVADTLLQAGISSAGSFQSNGTNLTAAAAAANASAANFLRLGGFTQQLGNNWTMFAPQVIGNYGSYYNARQFIAVQAYLALTPDIALYPSYIGANAGSGLSFPEGSKQAYLITFSGKPPLIPTGFWSLTIYGADNYLVPNSINQYALGDRSNLTYPDGTLVYGASNSSTGEFQILLQSSDVPPPENWTSNWIPTPAGGGSFANNLRFYGAAPAMTNGSYIYPQVTLIDAVTA